MSVLEIRVVNPGEEGPSFPEIKEYKYARVSIASIIADGVVDETGTKLPSIILGGKVEGGKDDGLYLCLEITSRMLETLCGATKGVEIRNGYVRD